MSLTFGYNLINHQSSRSSIVPYTILSLSENDQKILFLLGIDKRSGDITDFGGGVKKHEVDILGAIREFNEETKDIFVNNINLNDLSTCISVYYYDEMSVTFVPVSNDWIPYSVNKFPNTYRKGRNRNEIKNLIWLSEEQFLKLAINPSKDDQYSLWKKLKVFYSKVYNKGLSRLLRYRYNHSLPSFSSNLVKTQNSNCKEENYLQTFKSMYESLIK